MNIDYENESRKEKLLPLSNDGRLKLIWGWAKQEVINLTQFKELINYI